MHLTRREAIQRILAASVLIGAWEGVAWAEQERLIGFDPDLLEKDIPWPRVMTEAEKRAATALADLILPADDHGPAASEVGVVDFIDEWISAAYPSQVGERGRIRDGLAWLDKAAGGSFAEAPEEKKRALIEATVAEGTPEHEAGYRFFRLFRDRAAAGYFTTRDGWKAIGYTGNTPIGGDWPEPPAEALEHAKLA